ncbi:MAG: pyridoxal phosphate-dependent aminotransferase [Duncaniella sp.]|nr:pyridoxal phosphate-dependent aminotransferase [Duncaniella sp.]
MKATGIVNISSATIRQISALASRLERLIGEPFVHLEMGNPGLPASAVGVEAESEALRNGIANKYPNIAGIPSLKDNGSRFLKAFLDIDIPSRCIIPTVGSMQATFTLFLLLGQRLPGRDTILFLDPGFPAQHNQVKLLGLNQVSLDMYDCRGEALEARLDEILSSGKITALLYNNPNNPAWTNLTDTEYEILARMAEKHDVIIIEDHAYLGMDFRSRYGVPYQAPFVPTVAKWTDRCILLVSASKIFSYAGQRIAMVCMTPGVADRAYPYLEKFYEMPSLIDAYVFGVLYCASSGTAHSAQHAFAAMLGAAVDGKLDFVAETREYGRRAAIARKHFTDNGFHLVYAADGDRPISDGFFFTMGYPGMTGAELQAALLRYGISTISLPSTGSLQEGVRVCVSLLSDDDTFFRLGERLSMFHRDHPVS